MIRVITWFLFFGCTVAAGGSGFWFIGNLNANGWIAPSFAPPAWLFGPVWTILYLMIATSGYRIAYASKHELKPVVMGLWALQMCLNTLWTPVFFGAFDLRGAMIIILCLWATIAAFSILSRRVDKMASNLFLPYWAWVSFASLLNYGYLQING